MDRNPSKKSPGRQSSLLAYGAYGTFGTRRPAGRRYDFRSGMALAAFVIWTFGSEFLHPLVSKGILDPISALAPGGGVQLHGVGVP